MTRVLKAVPYLIVIAAAVYLFGVAHELRGAAGGGRIGPDVWPKIILTLMIGVCAYEIIRQISGNGGNGDASLTEFAQPAAAEPVDGDTPRDWPHLALAGVGLFLAYAGSIAYLGFLTATALMLGLFMMIGRYRNYRVILLTSIFGSLFFFFLFRKIVYISLPLGEGPFLQFSLAVMKLLYMN